MQPWEDCQEKSTQELGKASQGKDWGGYQCISHENITMHRCLQETSCSFYIPNIRTVLKQRLRQKNHTWAREEKCCSVAEWPKVFFLDQSKLCISFEHQGARVWSESEVAQYPRCLKSSVKLLQSVMIWGAVSPAGVGGGRVHCVLTSPSQHSIYQEVTLFLHLLTSFMETPISLSSRT